MLIIPPSSRTFLWSILPHNLGQELTNREKFAGMLNYSDYLIGRLVKAMDELGIRENTILFIVPDNGTDNGTDQNAEQSLGGRINGRVSEQGIYSLKEQGINMP